MFAPMRPKPIMPSCIVLLFIILRSCVSRRSAMACLAAATTQLRGKAEMLGDHLHRCRHAEGAHAQTTPAAPA